MKFSIILTFIFVALLANITLNYLENFKDKTIDTINEQKLLTSKATYKAIINTYAITATKDFHQITKQQKVLNLLYKFKSANKNEKNILRGKLYRLLYKTYNDMKKLYICQLQFHTDDGKSLLRFNLPYKNGDSLINFRKSIEIVNKTHKSVIGYEAGRVFPGYRYVFPIINNGNFLGSVEISISFSEIEKKLNELLPNNKYQQIMTKSNSIDTVFSTHINSFETSIFSKNYYIEALEITRTKNIKNNILITKSNIIFKNSKKISKKLKRHKDFSISFIEKNQGYSLNFIEFKNTNHKHAGYIVSCSKLDALVNIIHRYNLYYLLTLSFYFIVFILILVIIKQFNKSRLFKEKILNINKSLKKAQSIAHFGSWEIDLIHKRLYWSDEVYHIFELEPQSIKPDRELFLSYVYPDDIKEVTHIYNKSLETKTDYQLRHRIITKNNKIKYVEEYANHTYNQHGIAIKSTGAIYDITDQVQSYLKLEKFVDMQHSIVILTDGNNFEFANKSFLKFFGYDSLNEFKNSYNCICDFFLKKDGFFNLEMMKKNDKNWVESLLQLSDRKRIVSMLDSTNTPHAFLVAINNYDDKKYIIDFSDISDTMQEKLQLENQVNNDQLTNTYNRVFFTTSIHKIIQSHQQIHLNTAIIFFDIDHFKKINDTFGHPIGDKVLITLTTLVKKIIRKNDYLIRWGGEEFIIITSATKIDDVKHMAEYIRVAIQKLNIKDVGKFTCSFGVALRKKNEKIKTTIARADEKLYEAKNSGRNTVK